MVNFQTLKISFKPQNALNVPLDLLRMFLEQAQASFSNFTLSENPFTFVVTFFRIGWKL